MIDWFLTELLQTMQVDVLRIQHGHGDINCPSRCTTTLHIAYIAVHYNYCILLPNKQIDWWCSQQYVRLRYSDGYSHWCCPPVGQYIQLRYSDRYSHWCCPPMGQYVQLRYSDGYSHWCCPPVGQYVRLRYSDGYSHWCCPPVGQYVLRYSDGYQWRNDGVASDGGHWW